MKNTGGIYLDFIFPLSPGQGAPAKPFRMALAALFIRERLNCTDDELVEQIRENPNLQFFLGLERFTHEYPFDASMMVHFRKRITKEMLCEINEALVAKLRSSETPHSDEDTPESGASTTSSETPPPVKKNQGKLILDASCAPADITYPTDTKLLNAAREKSEELIDVLHAKRPPGSPKPRTYRRIARIHWLAFCKLRQPGRSHIRAMKRRLLGYLRRNLQHLDQLIDEVGLHPFNKAQYKYLLTLREVYRQQQEMFDQKTKRIKGRLVSLSQPHVRPIVRGKAGAKIVTTEGTFGVKCFHRSPHSCFSY